MVVNLGLAALALSFLCPVYAVGAGLAGSRHGRPEWVVSARNALVVIWPLLTLVGLAIIATLMAGDYNVVYCPGDPGDLSHPLGRAAEELEGFDGIVKIGHGTSG